jgi:hypothetical protein
MASLIALGLRTAQFLFVLLTTALVGDAIAKSIGGTPGAVNYAIFVAVWCWIAVLYGIAASVVQSLSVMMAHLVLDGMATFWTFIAGVVLAAKLQVHSCGNEVG